MLISCQGRTATTTEGPRWTYGLTLDPTWQRKASANFGKPDTCPKIDRLISTTQLWTWTDQRGLTVRSEKIRRVWVRSKPGQCRFRFDELCPDSGRCEEEELVTIDEATSTLNGSKSTSAPTSNLLGKVESRQPSVRMLSLRGLFPSVVSKDDSAIPEVLPIRQVAIDIDGLAVRARNRIVAVLMSDTLSLFFESLDGRVGPPVPQSTPFVVLRARVIWNTMRNISSSPKWGMKPVSSDAYRRHGSTHEQQPIRRRHIASIGATPTRRTAT